MDRIHKPKIIHIELGGGSAARSLAHRTTLRRAAKAGIAKLKKLSMFDDARLVESVMAREWMQERTPYYANVTKPEYRALSRALRADAYSLAGEARERGMVGNDYVAYRQFYAAVVRSRRLELNRIGEEARAKMMLEAGLRQAN